MARGRPEAMYEKFQAHGIPSTPRAMHVNACLSIDQRLGEMC